MWNNPQPAAYEPQSAAGGDPYAEVTWTSDQLQRMESEWRRLQRAFAYHPHVTLSPIQGDPPNAYQVDYRIQTLIVNPRSQQLEYVGNATVKITLPPGFPNDAPAVKPVTPIFHPNVSYEGIFIEGLWHPNETLLGLIRKIGEVLAFRSYDPDYAVNPAALDWLVANHQILPIDQQANLSPTAGGEPLSRICRYGSQSLDTMKQSMLATQSALFGQTSPDRATIRDYGNKTRLALNLFLEKDIPEELQAVASELELAARELVDLIPLCEFIKQKRAKVQGVRQTIRQLLASKDSILGEVGKFTSMVPGTDPSDPMAALKLIPETAKLQAAQLSLPKLVNDAQKRVDAIKGGMDAVATMADPPMIPPDSMLGRRLEREITATAGDADLTRREVAEAFHEFDPILQKAREEAAALEVTAKWREYLDMASKARWMEKQIREWGAEGLQAYFITNEGGKYGPFQFEQSVDLGTGDLIVRSLGGKSFEVSDPKADTVVGRSQTGSVVIPLKSNWVPPPPAPGEDPPAPPVFPTKFSVTERCDDLAVLLEFLRRSTIDIVTKHTAYEGKSDSWAGKICRLLAVPDVRKAIEEELAKAARRWRHTIGDLAALGPWKERLSTYFLVHRCYETIPQMVQVITDSRDKHRSSRRKVELILSKAGRDMETGSVVIPPKFSKQYSEELKLQETCAVTVKNLTAQLKSLVGQIMTRVQNAKVLGKGELPAMRVVRMPPEQLLGLPLADGQIGSLLSPIEHAVQVPLGGPAPEAVEQHAESGYEYAESEYAEHGQAGEEYAGQEYAQTEEYAEPLAGEVQEESDGASTTPPLATDVPEPVAEPSFAVPELEEFALPPALAGSTHGTEAETHHTDVAPVESATHPDAQWESVGQEWQFQDDSSEESGESTHEQYEESDVVFGFEPHPAPEPVKPPLPKK